MKILHTADWHIGKMLGGFSLLNDQEYFLNGLLQLMESERPDVLVIAGDIYDRPIPSGEAVGVLNRFLSQAILRLETPVLLIAGNHDSRERLSFGSELLSAAGLHIAGKLSHEVQPVTLSDSYGDVSFYLLPYVDPPAVNSLFPDDSVRTFQDAFDRMTAPILQQADFSQRNVLICHGTYCCTKSDDIQAADESVGGADLINLRPLLDFDYIAAGHIHRRQNIASQMRYSGSILKYSPNEHRLSPTVTMVELLQKGSCTVTERTVPILRDLKQIQGTFDQLLQREQPDSDYVFVVLEDKELILNAAMRLREKYPNLMGLSYAQSDSVMPHTLTAQTVHEKTLPELFGEFYKSINGEEIPPKLLATVEELSMPEKGAIV